jgi:hypothetical protein
MKLVLETAFVRRKLRTEKDSIFSRCQELIPFSVSYCFLITSAFHQQYDCNPAFDRTSEAQIKNSYDFEMWLHLIEPPWLFCSLVSCMIELVKKVILLFYPDGYLNFIYLISSSDD